MKLIRLHCVFVCMCVCVRVRAFFSSFCSFPLRFVICYYVVPLADSVAHMTYSTCGCLTCLSKWHFFEYQQHLACFHPWWTFFWMRTYYLNLPTFINCFGGTYSHRFYFGGDWSDTVEEKHLTLWCNGQVQLGPVYCLLFTDASLALTFQLGVPNWTKLQPPTIWWRLNRPLARH